MNPESCPTLYTCTKVRMTPMIRVLLRCTAAEAMESICANCEEWHGESESQVEVFVENEKNHTYVSPSGQKVTVMVWDKSREEDTDHDSDIA